jgi:hypothetical protein
MRHEGLACIALAREQAQLSPPQLEQVVGQANERPLRTDLRQPAKRKAAKPAPLFELSKHRLHIALRHWYTTCPAAVFNFSRICPTTPPPA